MQPELIGRLLSIIEASAVGSVRLVTLHLCITLLSHLLHLELTYTSTNPPPSSPLPTQSGDAPASLLSQHHVMKLERAMEEACRRMEKFYRSLVCTVHAYMYSVHYNSVVNSIGVSYMYMYTGIGMHCMDTLILYL